MRDDPAQIRNREFGMGRLIVLDLLLEIRRTQRVNLGAPARARDPLRGFHKDIVVRAGSASNEFTDSTGAYHVVAEEFVTVLKTFGQCRQICSCVLVEKVDPQPRRQFSFLVQSQEWQVHRVVVLVRSTIAWSVAGLEGTLIQVCRHAQRKTVTQCVDRTSTALFKCQQSLTQYQRRTARTLRAHGNRPISGNRNGRRLAFEECLTQTVRRRRTEESLRDVHGIVRRSLIKLRKRGQTWSLVRRKQMIAVESSNRRDPCATGNSLRASCQNFLHFANRVGILERRVITGPVPHQYNVIVIVDNAGHYCPSAKVDDADSRSLPRNATYCGETAILD